MNWLHEINAPSRDPDFIRDIPAEYIGYAMMVFPFGIQTYFLLNNEHITLQQASIIVKGAVSTNDLYRLFDAVGNAQSKKHEKVLTMALAEAFDPHMEIRLPPSCVGLPVGLAYVQALKAGMKLPDHLVYEFTNFIMADENKIQALNDAIRRLTPDNPEWED